MGISESKLSLIAGLAVAVLGLGMVAFGIYRGEMDVVFAKSVQICLECIGIG